MQEMIDKRVKQMYDEIEDAKRDALEWPNFIPLVALKIDAYYGCNCVARFNDLVRHRETCSITPDYAKTIESLGFSPIEVSTNIGFSMFNLVWKDWK